MPSKMAFNIYSAMEKQIKRDDIYKGKVIHVVKDEVLCDNGNTSIREVVLHNGGACIALKKDDKYFMVKQYRYPFSKEMLEFPAGKIENGEGPDETILREAVEETGYSVKNIRSFGYIIPTCGYCSEKIYLYYGEADEYLGQHFDKDENILLHQFTFKEIKEMVMNNQIDDAKTIALMYHIEMAGLDA